MSSDMVYQPEFRSHRPSNFIEELRSTINSHWLVGRFGPVSAGVFGFCWVRFQVEATSFLGSLFSPSLSRREEERPWERSWTDETKKPKKQNTVRGQTMNWMGTAKSLCSRHAGYIILSASCKKEWNCLDDICPTSANTPYCALRTSATVNRSYTLSESATVLRLSAAFSGPWLNSASLRTCQEKLRWMILVEERTRLRVCTFLDQKSAAKSGWGLETNDNDDDESLSCLEQTNNYFRVR